MGWRLSSGLVICRCDAAGGLGDNQPGASKNPPALSLERLLNKGQHSSNGDNSDDFSFGAAFLLLWARQGQIGLGCVVLLFTLSVAHCNWF